MAKIAIMGFGTVGSGVLEVIRRNAAAISRRAGGIFPARRMRICS